jgi:hypothetical protein
MFKIESGVPVPRRATNSKGYTAAVRALRPGQSVLLPITPSHAGYILSYLAAGKEIVRGEFTSRREGEGARIWHLEAGQQDMWRFVTVVPHFVANVPEIVTQLVDAIVYPRGLSWHHFRHR